MSASRLARARLLPAMVLTVAVLAGCAGDLPPPADAGSSQAPSTGPAVPSPERPSPAPAEDAPAERAAPVAGEPPTRLSIDDRTWPVVPVGVDSAQALEIPGDLSTLGWWREGAAAGADQGFTVLTGHATRDGGAAANRWWSLEPGDVVEVGTGEGSTEYQVTSRTTYADDEMPYARWFPSTPQGDPALALITCSDYRDGDWQANTVVEAVPLQS